MTKVYLAGSFKHYGTLRKIQQQFIDAQIECLLSSPDANQGIEGCLQRIDQSDITFIVNFDGYVGKSVTLDIGYALGVDKPIYALEPISDPDITHLICGVKSVNQLIDLIHSSASTRP
ncbi:TIR domain-containing protein [Ferrimonas aestuarii]|uniref:Nucleotide pyrophosphohydrolase n=1 Tax=Ferrimonas aestuarii TaxID=2569539 RepID=A0A4U1BFI4_9GAMM|nr:nucleotide pyrophosphohydrolase [Ferrimonas aestuarii]TKB49168.1 nucleotide pyrophosphohydrolase [Ferrimonas aestuarii]